MREYLVIYYNKGKWIGPFNLCPAKSNEKKDTYAVPCLGQQPLVSLRNILDAGDQSQVSSVHGKHPTHCTISLTSLILIL